MAFYPRKSILAMEEARAALPADIDTLRLRYFMARFKTAPGRDVAMMGFLRRLRPMLRTVDQVFTIAPPPGRGS